MIIDSKKYVSSAYGNGTTTVQPILMLPEKCVFDNPFKDNMWCASELTPETASHVEDWYKGILTSHDELWYSKLSTKRAMLVGNLSKLSGRIIDVTNITINSDGTLLLFSNKTNQTLWLYKIVR